MMTAALVGAMYYGAIMIFCMIGLMGMSVEMALKKSFLKEVYGKRTRDLHFERALGRHRSGKRIAVERT